MHVQVNKLTGICVATPKKWQETLFEKEIQTGSCFFLVANERLWSCPTSLKPQRYLVDEIGTSDVTLRRSTSNSSKNLWGYSMLWCSEFCWFAEFNKSLTVLWFQKFKVDFPKARNSVELRAFSSQAGSWRPFHLINRHLVPLMTTCIVEAGSVASCTQGQTKLYQFTLSHFITKKSVGECHFEADSGQHHREVSVIETYSAPFPMWCEFQ